MQATTRAARRLVSQSLLRSNTAHAPLSSAAAFQRTVPTSALCATASDVFTAPRSRRWLFPPAFSSRTVPAGLAGALSFSMTLVTLAEAKEPPSPERIPKDVVLYQYEACPFCNKVKGNSFSFFFYLRWCLSTVASPGAIRLLLTIPDCCMQLLFPFSVDLTESQLFAWRSSRFECSIKWNNTGGTSPRPVLHI